MNWVKTGHTYKQKNKEFINDQIFYTSNLDVELNKVIKN